MFQREYGVGIIGVGKAVPEKVVTNLEIEEMCQIPSGEIGQKTGIELRHLAGKDDSASKLSAQAAQMALDKIPLPAQKIKLVVGCTFTGDYIYPSLSCKVHQMLSMEEATTFDLMANCTGFQVGLSVASDRMMVDNEVDYSLVLGTALQSRFINWKDPHSAIYFGDGAGAAILGQVPSGYGFLSHATFAHTKAYDAVRMRGGGSSFPLTPDNIHDGLQFYEINGLEVWKQVMQFQPKVVQLALKKAGLSTADVNLFIFHQANLRLIEYLMGKMKLPMEKTFTNVARYGNTAEASMAIALCEAVETKQIKRGDIVVLSGVGAGFIFGASVLRWY